MEVICNTHNDTYTSFCNKCQKNLCVICEKQHQNHDKIAFGKIMVEKEQLEERMKSLKDEIVKMDKNIKEMINILNKVNNHMNNYYNCIEKIINNFDVKNRNMEKMYNINKIYENIENVIKDIKKGITQHPFNYTIKFKNIMEIYNKINSKEDYFIYKIDKNRKLKLFGDTFLDNNKKFKETCIIECEGKEFAYKDFNIDNFSNKETLEIKIKGIEKITNPSFMFVDKPLISLPNNISDWNTKNWTDISHMFSYCNLLSYLPDISNWNTKNVEDLDSIFSGCSSLISLPDISKWNTNKVTTVL
jgi:surface protein